MFKALLLPLVKYFTFFNIFQYITFRAAYAVVTALLISFIFGPRLFGWLKKKRAGESIREDVPDSHQSKSGTPTMGGLLILISIVAAVLVWQDLSNYYTWIALFTLLSFGAVGFIDDYMKTYGDNSPGMKARVKFIIQLLLASAIVSAIYAMGDEQTTLLYVPFLKHPVADLGLLFIPFGALLITGFSNAVNFTDGLDGLAIGLTILVAVTLAIITYLTGRVDYAAYLNIPYMAQSGELTILCAGLIGASIGFLWYNCHPAEVFMGDVGSLSLGAVISVIALLIKKEILLFVICGVFVMEVVSVILQVISFKLRGKRIFKMSPLHHHFELSGWPESKVVIRFWILGGLFVILSLSTLKIQ